MLLIFGGKILGSVMEKGLDELIRFSQALLDWYDNPIGFFTFYIVGYILLWKNVKLGSIVILATSILSTLINFDNLGWLIFTLPTALVGISHLVFNRHFKP